MGSKNPWRIEPKFFLVLDVHDIITPFKFGDDQFRCFWLAEGQILLFPIDFEGRPYNTHTIVWGVMDRRCRLYRGPCKIKKKFMSAIS